MFGTIPAQVLYRPRRAYTNRLTTAVVKDTSVNNHRVLFHCCASKWAQWRLGDSRDEYPGNNKMSHRALSTQVKLSDGRDMNERMDKQMDEQAAERTNEPRVAVLGAGPKAAALHVLSCVLRRLNRPSVHVVSWEMHKPAAYWDGAHGFTDGLCKLGTSPLKDVTYPGSFGNDPQLERELSRFSWLTYLRCIGEFDRWVDRSCPPCTHAQWAAYLRWTLVEAGADTRQSEIQRVEPTGTGKVRVHLSHHEPQEFDGFVFSGPGEPRGVPLHDTRPGARRNTRLLDARSYWTRRHDVRDARRVAVVGTGESAAAILQDLLRMTHVDVTVITAHGHLPMRDESFSMNTLFSRGGSKRWRTLPLDVRRQIIRRGDRGVLSPACHHEMMRSQSHVQEIDGYVEYVSFPWGTGPVSLHIRRLSGTSSETQQFDYAILAIGFDVISSVRRILSERFQLGNNDEQMVERIDEHLRLPDIDENIHVPAMSTLAQGPGFANLSSLNLTAMQILRAYIDDTK